MNRQTSSHDWIIANIVKAMMEYSEHNLHDITHFLKVWSLAKTIGTLEQLEPDTQLVLETAAIVHDIACPLCRQKYGHTHGPQQELEGQPLTRDFLRAFPLTEAQKQRVEYLVGHHHTLKNIQGSDYQILIEADYLVNAEESHYSVENLRHARQSFFKTPSGITLLEAMFVNVS